MLLGAALAVLGVDLAAVAAAQGNDELPGDLAAAAVEAGWSPPSTVPSTVPPPAAVVAEPVPTTTVPAPTTTVPPVTTTLAPDRASAWTLAPLEGLGVWLDVYDWTNELTGGAPKVGLADIDRMADLGIQTLYIQTGHRRSASHVIEADRLLGIIDRAHARGMAVVAWYLPMLEDVATDLHRLYAASQLPVDGLGVDIESLAVADPAERTRRLLELSTALRQVLGPDPALIAITPSAVHLQVVNPGFWPAFPWPELAATYDAIVPMSYWSVRKTEWRSGERYTGENIDRIRASTGRPDIPIHVAGGIADAVSPADLEGMVRAIQARGILGGSLYDWNTSQPGQWDVLRALRVG